LPLFTEHELDEEFGAGAAHGAGGLNEDECGNKGPAGEAPLLLRNQSTKSFVLAPFNSTWSDKRMQAEHQGVDPALILDKRVIKYANRVKDLNRQYEMNNNCDLDNGVYNKFVNQSSSSESDGGIPSSSLSAGGHDSGVVSSSDCKRGSRAGGHQKPNPQSVRMFDSQQLLFSSGDMRQADLEEDEDDGEENSLVTSMNNGGGGGGDGDGWDLDGELVHRRISNVPQAPLVSQISEDMIMMDHDEDQELERIMRQNNDQA